MCNMYGRTRFVRCVSRDLLRKVQLDSRKIKVLPRDGIAYFTSLHQYACEQIRKIY